MKKESETLKLITKLWKNLHDPLTGTPRRDKEEILKSSKVRYITKKKKKKKEVIRDASSLIQYITSIKDYTSVQVELKLSSSIPLWRILLTESAISLLKEEYTIYNSRTSPRMKFVIKILYSWSSFHTT